MTMIGAIALDGFRGFLTIDSGTTSEVFYAFVEHELVPNLRSGDIVVMDNRSAHKNPRARALIRTAGAVILYLPAYSPEFNPIEKAWAKMKDITTSDIRAWARFAGYRLD